MIRGELCATFRLISTARYGLAPSTRGLICIIRQILFLSLSLLFSFGQLIRARGGNGPWRRGERRRVKREGENKLGEGLLGTMLQIMISGISFFFSFFFHPLRGRASGGATRREGLKNDRLERAARWRGGR